MTKKEVPSGVFFALLISFIVTPGIVIWKVLYPVWVAHDPSQLGEHQYFFWTGIVVLAVIFGLLEWELVAGYRPKRESFWRVFMNAMAYEFDFSINPFAIPLLLSLGLFFTGIVMTFASGRPTWASIQIGSIGLLGLILFSWLDNRRKKKMKKQTPSP